MEQRENDPSLILGNFTPPSELSVSAQTWTTQRKPHKGLNILREKLEYLDLDLHGYQQPDAKIPYYITHQTVQEPGLGDPRSHIIRATSKSAKSIAIKLEQKQTEVKWALDVFGNTQLSADEKLDQLPDFLGWLVKVREVHGKFVGNGFTDLLPQKLAPIIYEVVSDKIRRDGEIPKKFAQFICKLSEKASEESNPEYAQEDTGQRKQRLASSFIGSFAGHMEVQLTSLNAEKDPELVKTKTEAIIKLVDFFLENEIRVSTGEHKNPKVLNDSWYYRNLVKMGNFYNPTLVGAFLARVAGGERIFATSKTIRHNVVHDDAVRTIVGIVDALASDKNRNTTTAKGIGQMLSNRSAKKLPKKTTKPAILAEDVVSVANAVADQLTSAYSRVGKTVEYPEIFVSDADALPMALMTFMEATRKSTVVTDKQRQQELGLFSLVSCMTALSREKHDKEFLEQMVTARKEQIERLLGEVATFGGGRKVIIPKKSRGEWNVSKPGYGKLG